jgi:ubiquinone/menaquinone biosynthesis C-methylase UbiE
MKALYDQIGSGYDITRKADPEITRRLYHHLQMQEHQTILDIACGTGNYTVALRNLDVHISGSDISNEMLEKARQKSEDVEWYHCDVQDLPFRSNAFNGAICTLAVHHFKDLTLSFKEISRVIVPGGRFILFTAAREQMKRYWLNEYFPEMMRKSTAQMPSLAQIRSATEQAGFVMHGYESFLIQPNLEDFFLYSGKHRPEIYLNAEVRRGISSFANLVENKEIEEGITKLSDDIQSGRFNEVFQTYCSDLGDYMFVVAEKRME